MQNSLGFTHHPQAASNPGSAPTVATKFAAPLLRRLSALGRNILLMIERYKVARRRAVSQRLMATLPENILADIGWPNLTDRLDKNAD